MRLLTVLSLTCLLTLGTFAQTSRQSKNLIVTLEVTKDKTNDAYYFTLQPEPGSKPSGEIVNLVTWSGQAYGASIDTAYFFSSEDTTKRFWNYFKSKMEALDYLGMFGWQVITVVQEPISGHKFVDNGKELVPVTTVSSRQVIFLRKEF